MTMHVHTTRLSDALEPSELTAAGLAEASGLGLDRIEGLLAGTRRLSGRENLERLATPLGLQWQALSCDGKPPDRCPACRAHNRISDAELGSLREAWRQVLDEGVTRLRLASRGSGGRAEMASRLTDLASHPAFANAQQLAAALGGDLDSHALERTGVIMLLADAAAGGTLDDLDLGTIVADLARYAGGGDCEHLQLVGLDIDGAPDGPTPVAGWELVRLTEADLDRFAPVPAAAHHQPHQAWSREVASRMWYLRRSQGFAPPIGLVVRFRSPFLYEPVWRPLVVLALYQDEIPRVAVEYRVEVGRRVQRIAGQELEAFPAGPDEDEGYLQVQYGPFGIPADEHERFTRFASAVSPLLDSLATQTRTERCFARAATHFLSASESHLLLGAEGKALMDYSIALETLLGGDAKTEVSRRVSQRAAVLCAFDDDGRLEVKEQIAATYDAGSSYRHGDEPWKLHTQYDSRPPAGKKKTLDLATVHHLTRKVLLRWLIVAAGQDDPVPRLERAILSRQATDEIASAVRSFAARVAPSAPTA
jgi:hypothetical protein